LFDLLLDKSRLSYLLPQQALKVFGCQNHRGTGNLISGMITAARDAYRLLNPARTTWPALSAIRLEGVGLFQTGMPKPSPSSQGLVPMVASSGQTHRHRLNRGGTGS
jgi:hypothetical protein